MDATQQLWEAITKDDLPGVKKALAAGAEVNSADGYGKNSLMVSCHFGNTGIVSLLLSNGADVFQQDDNGKTALFYAAEKGHKDIVELLMNRLTGTGVSPQRLALLEIKDINGETAADAAKEFGFKEIADIIEGEIARMEYSE